MSASRTRARAGSARRRAAAAMSRSPCMPHTVERGHFGAGRRVLPPGWGVVTLLALSIGYFMVILDTTVVNVALPVLGRSLHAGTDELQWVIDAYAVVFAALLVSMGSLADRAGARRALIFGLALFTAASAACGLAGGAGVLIAARAGQGVGAGVVVPASPAALRPTYADPAARARAVGAWGGIAGVAAASGPMVGGALASGPGWRAVFFVNVPVGLLGLALAVRYLRPVAPRPAHLDAGAQVAVAVALGALTFALIEGAAAAFVVAAVAAVAFVVIERRVAQPMLPLGLFRRAGFSSGTLVGLLINLGFYGQLFVLSLWFQHERGDSSLAAGLALLPLAGMATIASVVSGRVMGRTGAGLPMLVGLALGAAGWLGLLAADAQTSGALLVAPLMAAGFGMALTMPAATAAVVEAVPAERAGLASGVLNAARQAGGAIGVALLGSLGGLHAAAGA